MQISPLALRERYASMPTEELAILLHRDQLTEEALQLLQNELVARGISDIAALATAPQTEEPTAISWEINQSEFLWLVGYALIFPLSALIPFWLIEGLGMLITYPFIPIAGVVGIAATAIFNNDHAYLVGAATGIFFQCYLCFVTTRWLMKRKCKLAEHPR